MGVACQTASLAAVGLMDELEANREHEGKDKLDKRLGGAHEGKVGRLIVEVDGNRAVLAYRFGGPFHVSPSGKMAVGADGIS